MLLLQWAHEIAISIIIISFSQSMHSSALFSIELQLRFVGIKTGVKVGKDAQLFRNIANELFFSLPSFLLIARIAFHKNEC